MAEQRIAFEVLDFEPGPVPAEMDAFPHGQRLLRIRFVDGPITTYPSGRLRRPPFEDAIQEAIASGQIYWFEPASDTTPSTLEGESTESVPGKMLRALRDRQVTDEIEETVRFAGRAYDALSAKLTDEVTNDVMRVVLC